RVDVWALGVVAYEVFAGKKLFEDDNDATLLWEIVSGDPFDFSALPPELPESIRSTIAKCLVRDREGRLGSCRELAEASADAGRELDCRGAVEVENLMTELAADRKALLDRHLVEIEKEPADPVVADASSGVIDRAAKTSPEIPLSTPEQTRTDAAVSAS